MKHTFLNLKILIFIKLSIAMLFIISSCQKETTELKVLQFNVWQEGAMVKGGFEAIADEIAKYEPDFVTLSEVRNYNNTRFCDRIVKALKDRGLNYYSFYSQDSGLLSHHPIVDSTTTYPYSMQKDQGSIYRLVSKMPNGLEVAVYTAHLDYRSCAYYDVRGYNGSTWEKEAPIVDIDSILAINKRSLRDDAIKDFIVEAKKDIAEGRFIIIGGDFNEPSHLDWTAETANLYDHHGIQVPWDVSKLLSQEGYIDSYRSIYEDPVSHPGITYPADNQLIETNRLSWTPLADERERIDFIYYYPHKCVELKDSYIVGPAGSIALGQRVLHESSDSICSPIAVWPSDHKAVMSVFTILYPFLAKYLATGTNNDFFNWNFSAGFL